MTNNDPTVPSNAAPAGTEEARTDTVPRRAENEQNISITTNGTIGAQPIIRIPSNEQSRNETLETPVDGMQAAGGYSTLPTAVPDYLQPPNADCSDNGLTSLEEALPDSLAPILYGFIPAEAAQNIDLVDPIDQDDQADDTEFFIEDDGPSYETERPNQGFGFYLDPPEEQ